jgi:hypothetical protein
MHRFKHRWIKPRATREQLAGYSYSRFKTLLKRLRYKIARDFFKNSEGVVRHGSRLYRFRYWGDHYTGDTTFVVDISCPIGDFDRWANSIERTITFTEWLRENKK